MPGGEKAEKKQAAPSQEDAKVDVSRLDMRVGRIISAQKHPDADSLYVEQVDLGEASPRTVVSGLVKHIPLDQVQHSLCNDRGFPLVKKILEYGVFRDLCKSAYVKKFARLMNWSLEEDFSEIL